MARTSTLLIAILLSNLHRNVVQAGEDPLLKSVYRLGLRLELGQISVKHGRLTCLHEVQPVGLSGKRPDAFCKRILIFHVTNNLIRCDLDNNTQIDLIKGI
jgi:hypothetical protein